MSPVKGRFARGAGYARRPLVSQGVDHLPDGRERQVILLSFDILNQRQCNEIMMLQAQGVSFSYPELPLFRALDLTVEPGVTLVTGERGKSTLLRLLAGDLAPQAGWIAAGGVRQDLDPVAYRNQVFWIEPATNAHDQRSPREFFGSLAAGALRLNVGVAEEVAVRLGLEPHLDKAIYMLSAGSRRKVWMSAAFASAAPVVLIDDLFAALDRPSIEALSGLLAAQARRNERAWLVAHYDIPHGVPLRATIDLDALAGGQVDKRTGG